MSKHLQTNYPFANQDLWTVGSEIFYGEEDFLISAETGQPTFPKIHKGFAKKVEYNDRRFAHKFYPLGKEKTIVVNPKIQFGLPTIEGTRILTDVIYDMILGGVNKQDISESYGIDINNIEDVIEFSKAA